MVRANQLVPLAVAILLATLAALGFRFFAMAGVPEQITVVVAEVPLQPGEVFRSEMVRTATVYFNPGLRGILREDEIPSLEGGRILMFVPPGSVVPRTAIVPPGEDDAPGRLFNAAASGENLMVIPSEDRIISPPFSRLRPGDCLDMIAFFSGDGTGPVMGEPVVELSPPGVGEAGASPGPGLPTPVPSPAQPPQPGTTAGITETAPVTVPVRPVAKLLGRLVVRSVLDIPPPEREGQTSGLASQAGRLLVAIPPEAGEGIVYAMGAAERIHLILVPPCERASIPPSPAFSEEDLKGWIRYGRVTAGPPAFFMSLTPTPGPGTTNGGGGENSPSP
ncbi:hypothetical protein [Thermoflexus sp.]|uniref:hypothetical protein n=1 Tax=Thermoflexus sp. TaxID=1969742 RepID=UPI002ADD8BF4|nr:hypothetical protein [Thermoflexus sp.]